MRADRPLQEMRWHYPLEHREPATGFASRLAALNGRPLGKFLREMAVHPRTLDKATEPAVKAVAVLGGANFEALVRYTPQPLDSDFWGVGGERLRRLSINRTYFRYCPRCVHEDLRTYAGPIPTRPWMRLEWIVAFFRSCPKHGILLKQAWPERRPFEPFDFSDTMKGLLPQIDIDSGQPISSSGFQAWVTARIDGVRDPGNWLDDVGLYAAAEFCEALGLSSLHEPKVRTRTLSMSDWAVAANEGFRIASDGEASIRGLLSKLNEAQVSTRGVWGLRDTYGQAYGLLQRTIEDPAYEKLRDVVRRFAVETMPLEPGTNVLGQRITERKIHTIRTASRDSGAHTLTIRKFFKLKGLAKSRGFDLMDHRVTVEADEIRKIVESLKGALTTPQVEKRTGIPRLHLKELISAGYLPTITDSRNRSYAKHRFTPADVDALMERLFFDAVEVHDPAPRQLSIQEVRLAATATLSQLLAFVFENKVTWKGRLTRTSGYEALLLDADEITRLVRSGQAKTGFTRREAMNFIPGMGRDSVQRFIENGYLTEIEEFNPQARRITSVISRESAETFKASYVSLGELSHQTRLHHKRVRLVLRLAEIEAAFDPDQFGCFFYQRANVERKQSMDPKFWDYDQKKNPTGSSKIARKAH